MRRHNAARNYAAKVTPRAGLKPEIEKIGLLPSKPDAPDQDARRPADVYLPAWLSGEPMALDFAVASPQRQEVLRQASFQKGFASSAYDTFKRCYQNTEAACRSQGFSFQPMVVEPTGGWSADAVLVWKQLARLESRRTGEPEASVAQRYFQQLSVRIRRACADCILRRAQDRTEEPLVV